MKKKIMSVLLSTAMVASMLAGCGSTTNEETSDATVAATKAAAQESTVAEEGGSETTGDGDLTSWILAGVCLRVSGFCLAGFWWL